VRTARARSGGGASPDDGEAPHAAADLPASDASDAQRELGGARLETDRWEGYVAGTDDDGLFTIQLSGLKDAVAVAGLTIAFVEGPGQRANADLAERLQNAARLLPTPFGNTGLAKNALTGLITQIRN
jgi:hypothetical protein